MYTVFNLFVAVAALSAAIRPASAQGLTRLEAVQTALDNNPRVAAGLEAWRAAKARRLVALAPEDPELEIEFEELPGVFDTGQFGERNIGITQRIESPLKWWFRQRAFGQEAEFVRYSALEATRLEVATRAKVLFDRLLADQEMLASSEDNLRLTRDFARKTRIRFESGDVSRLEPMRADVQVGLAGTQLADAEARLAISKASLNTVLGRDASIPVEITGELSLASETFDLEALKSLAMARRPDLLGGRQSLMSARSSQSGTVASLVPDLSLSISRQTVAGANSRSSSWRTTFGIEIPVWALFRQRGEISGAAAEVRKAEAENKDIRQSAMLEVESRFASLTAARKKAELFQTGILKLAEAAHEATSESYRQGKATYLDLLEAQRTLTETRIANFESIFDYRRALAELEQATGGSLGEAPQMNTR